jgi:hypothetical protein
MGGSGSIAIGQDEVVALRRRVTCLEAVLTELVAAAKDAEDIGNPASKRPYADLDERGEIRDRFYRAVRRAIILLRQSKTPAKRNR